MALEGRWQWRLWQKCLSHELEAAIKFSQERVWDLTLRTLTVAASGRSCPLIRPFETENTIFITLEYLSFGDWRDFPLIISPNPRLEISHQLQECLFPCTKTALLAAI